MTDTALTLHDIQPNSDGERVLSRTKHGWERADSETTGCRWVIVGDRTDLEDAARRHGVSEPALELLAHRGAGSHATSLDHPVRARLDRSPDEELVLTVPTLSYVEASRDVHTGAVTTVVGDGVVLTCELGDAGVIEMAVRKLTGGFPVPDDGEHQVLADGEIGEQ